MEEHIRKKCSSYVIKPAQLSISQNFNFHLLTAAIQGSIKGDRIKIRIRIKSGCLTPAFSGAHMRAEVLSDPCVLGGVSIKGDKVKSGYLTPAFSGPHIRADVLRNPRVLGCPETRGQNQKWLPHHRLLGGPHEGGSAT